MISHRYLLCKIQSSEENLVTARYFSYGIYSHFFLKYSISSGASLVASKLKNPSARQETWVRPLGQEDPLEKEMATHSSFLVWETPQSPWGSQKVGYNLETKITDIISSGLKYA